MIIELVHQYIHILFIKPTTTLLTLNGVVWYNNFMKLIKVTIISGANIYVNPLEVAYLRSDPMDPTVTWIYAGDMVHKIKLSLEETVKLLEKSK